MHWLPKALACVALAVSCSSLYAQAAPQVDFDKDIAPLLATRCLGCHSGGDPKGGLDLSTRATAIQGGESGATFKAGQPDDSLLWQQVESDEMPPKKSLTAEEKAKLRAWLVSGATWGTDKIDPYRYSSDGRAGLDWWSLQPLQATAPSNPDIHPVDAYLQPYLAAAGLSPSPRADKRTLIRRLYFDLLGLPPTPAEVDEFLADDSPGAYSILVDRLLMSTHYGERWARHWLDVVRYGESNGYEYDEPRDNFWPYRNWVIDAFNSDMPYDDFVRRQLAGDALAPDDLSAAAATGFLVAGPHNTTLPSNAKMRMAMAQDEMEDLVGIVGQTFLGLTINCARCHDHKFDPITQKEYYQIAAALGGVTHGQRTIRVPLKATQRARLKSIDQQSETLTHAINATLEPVREVLRQQRIAQAHTPSAKDVKAEGSGTAGKLSAQTLTITPPKALAAWEFDGDTNDANGNLHLTLSGNARIENGVLVLDGQSAMAVSPWLTEAIGEKTLEAWVTLTDLDQQGGGVLSLETKDGGVFDAIVYGEQEARKWMAGSNSFVRTKSFQAADVETEAFQQPVHVALVYRNDGTITAYRNGQPYGTAYRSPQLQPYDANTAHLIFGLRHSPVGGNRMLAGRIERAQFYNRALTADEVGLSAAYHQIGIIPDSVVLAQLIAEQRTQLAAWQRELEQLQVEKTAIQKSEQQSLYACLSTLPPKTHVLLRGDVGSPAEEVVPAGLRALSDVNGDWQLENQAGDHQRRLKLAAWVTDKKNPLFTRVIVNRLWQYHFGEGLVGTSSDFGFNGGRPSHPELLDWLASQLLDHGYSLKAIQKLIVTSEAFCQSSAPRTDAIKVDANNKLLWRKSPMRLEAETLRDTLLAVTDRLDKQVGGSGYRDMRHFFFKGSNFYELLDETGPDARRRTIYRFSPRGSNNPFLSTFDCPDPSATAPRRAVTTTPLQALALLNNSMVFELADSFALRVVQAAGSDQAAQVQAAYEIAYNRRATDSEVALCTSYMQQNNLAALCRVIFNSNEFLYVR